MQRPQNLIFIKLGNYLYSNASKIEIPLFFIVLVSIIVSLTQTFDLSVVLVLTATALSMLYFFMSYSLSDLGESPSVFAIFFRKLLYITLSISSMGMVFYINQYAGYQIMINISIVTLAGCLLSYFFLRIRKPEINLLAGADTRRILLFIAVDVLVAVDILNINTP